VKDISSQRRSSNTCVRQDPAYGDNSHQALYSSGLSSQKSSVTIHIGLRQRVLDLKFLDRIKKLNLIFDLFSTEFVLHKFVFSSSSFCRLLTCRTRFAEFRLGILSYSSVSVGLLSGSTPLTQ